MLQLLRRVSLCLLVPALAAVPASAQVVALDADFNQNTVGEQPPTDLPGDPAGDRMTFTTSGGTVQVADAYGVMTDQPLVYHRTSLSALTIVAYVAPQYEDCNSYLIRWTSMVDQEVGFFGISFRASGNWQLAQFQYYEGFVLNMNGFQNPLSVGYAAGVPQLFELTIDLVNERTSLSIDGNPVPEAQNLPYVQANLTGTFQSILFTGGGTEYPDFVIDDLEVIADCGTVAAEPITWSRLKTLYGS